MTDNKDSKKHPTRVNLEEGRSFKRFANNMEKDKNPPPPPPPPDKKKDGK